MRTYVRPRSTATLRMRERCSNSADLAGFYGGPEGSLRASKLRRFQIGLNCVVVVPSIVHGKVRGSRVIF